MKIGSNRRVDPSIRLVEGLEELARAIDNAYYKPPEPTDIVADVTRPVSREYKEMKARAIMGGVAVSLLSGSTTAGFFASELSPLKIPDLIHGFNETQNFGGMLGYAFGAFIYRALSDPEGSCCHVSCTGDALRGIWNGMRFALKRRKTHDISS